MKGAIFDMDGLLLDSERLTGSCGESVIGGSGGDAAPDFAVRGNGSGQGGRSGSWASCFPGEIRERWNLACRAMVMELEEDRPAAWAGGCRASAGPAKGGVPPGRPAAVPGIWCAPTWNAPGSWAFLTLWYAGTRSGGESRSRIFSCWRPDGQPRFRGSCWRTAPTVCWRPGQRAAGR